MAEEYGFEYELVQYKWPRWLHAQTEKQRIIWGYVYWNYSFQFDAFAHGFSINVLKLILMFLSIVVEMYVLYFSGIKYYFWTYYFLWMYRKLYLLMLTR